MPTEGHIASRTRGYASVLSLQFLNRGGDRRSASPRCAWSPSLARRRPYPAGQTRLLTRFRHRRQLSLDSRRVGSCITGFGPSATFMIVTAYKLAKSAAMATLYTGGFTRIVDSAIAPTATGWSEPVPPGAIFTRCGPAVLHAHAKVGLSQDPFVGMANGRCVLRYEDFHRPAD